MKNIKQLLLLAALTISTTFGASVANAGTIYSTISIVDDPVFGTIEIGQMELNFNNNLIDSGLGLVSTYDDLGFSLESLTVFGLETQVEDFEAFIDVDNFFSDLYYVYIDVTDLPLGPESWAYQLDYFQDGTGFGLDIFENGEFVLSTPNIAIESVFVPEPSVAAMLLLVVGAAAYRRRRT
tara:strand:- start:4 stop:546 length:543 start_codon:yes stop_codon:yes gene_type:complete